MAARRAVELTTRPEHASRRFRIDVIGGLRPGPAMVGATPDRQMSPRAPGAAGGGGAAELTSGHRGRALVYAGVAVFALVIEAAWRVLRPARR